MAWITSASLPLCSCLGQAVLAERVRDLQRERHEARKHPPLYRCGEEEQQPGPGAVAHHRLPRQGTPRGLQRCIFFSLLSHFQSECTKAEYTIGDRTVFLMHSFLYTVCCIFSHCFIKSLALWGRLRPPGSMTWASCWTFSLLCMPGFCLLHCGSISNQFQDVFTSIRHLGLKIALWVQLDLRPSDKEERIRQTKEKQKLV